MMHSPSKYLKVIYNRIDNSLNNELKIKSGRKIHLPHFMRASRLKEHLNIKNSKLK